MRWPPWRRLPRAVPDTARAVRDAQRSLVATERRWPEVIATAETLRGYGNRNHFSDKLAAAMRKAP